MTIITGMLLKKLCEKGDSNCSLIATSITFHRDLNILIDKREDMLRSKQLGSDPLFELYHCALKNSAINVCVVLRARRTTFLLCDF